MPSIIQFNLNTQRQASVDLGFIISRCEADLLCLQEPNLTLNPYNQCSTLPAFDTPFRQTKNQLLLC